jgi:Flp pilus assembly CpaE family ATPase
VLLSPVSIDPSEPAQLVDSHLGDALHACRRAYRFTVFDAPRVATSVAALLGGASVATLIVCQLAVRDIRAVRTLVRILTDRGLPSERVVAVVNRYRKRRSTITLREAREALGDVKIRCLPNDFRRTSRAIDFGKPLAEVSRRSALRRGIAQLASQLLELESRGNQL